MKKRLLDLLCCPDCRQENFDVVSYTGGQNGSQEILEGEIRCLGCESRFPVINSIPRMLPASLRRSLQSFHRDFFERHPEVVSRNGATGTDERVARTLEGYSYQHVKLDDRGRELPRWRQIFHESIPLDWRGKDFFRGKIGADIGCGEGRFLYCAQEFGAEMVGLDLSEGVEVARNNTAESARCHVVQGDIHHLPFKPGVFDFAYSIGVLHHLPDPHDGFKRILPAVRQGGKVSIWVYGLREMRWWYRLSHMTLLRGVAPRLPRSGQYWLSLAIAGCLEVAIWLPCRIVSRFPGGQSIVNRIPLGDACRRSFRAKIRSVFDRIQPPVTHFHTADELDGWFKEAGFMNIAVLNKEGRGWIAAGEKG
ncbi:MAG: methyltransferase domain-containing protein [Candidatus Binatia bacterium]